MCDPDGAAERRAIMLPPRAMTSRARPRPTHMTRAPIIDTSGTDRPAAADRRRWLALYLLCLGTLMIVLDTTIVNVALPSIRGDLGFSEASLAWVVNAYLLTFGGFLLLGGRLGDLYGQRRLFVIGIALFTVASLACGMSTTQGLLVGA